MQGDRDDPAFRADLIFRGLVYGDHPYARDPRGSAREIARLTLDDVHEHHRRHFTADNAFLVAVGDFEPRRLRALVTTHFQSWPARNEPVPPLPRLVRAARSRVRRVAHPGEQVHIVLGHLGIPRNHPDFDVLAVLDHILGSGPGFTDRLSRLLRDEMGLAYTVGGGITDSADIAPGLFRVYVGTMPDEADRVVAAIVDQVRAMHAGAFSDDEVDRARRYLAGSWVFDFQTIEQRAERLLELERWELGLDEPIRWPERIADHPPSGPPRRADPPRSLGPDPRRIRPDPPPRPAPTLNAPERLRAQVQPGNIISGGTPPPHAVRAPRPQLRDQRLLWSQRSLALNSRRSACSRRRWRPARRRHRARLRRRSRGSSVFLCERGARRAIGPWKPSRLARKIRNFIDERLDRSLPSSLD